jgi:hypothetical protein
MNHLKDELLVTVVDGRDHFATEPSNVSLYQPKGEYRTSLQQTRFDLPLCDGPVRNLATVCRTESANTVERLRCWEQLKRMAKDGDPQAQAVVDALRGLVIN